MFLMKQSTAHTFRLGPFISDSDGKTASTSLTIAATSVFLSKAGAAYAAKNESTALTGTGDARGYYTCLLDTTDTGTLGSLRVHAHISGALPVWQDFQVVPAMVFDSLVAGSDFLQADVIQLNSVTASATNLERSASVIRRGTSTNAGFTATSTTFDTDLTEATTDHYKGRIVIFTSGALLDQASGITGYSLVSGRGRFVINSLTEAVPDATTFVIA